MTARRSLLIWMLLAVAAVAGLAYWDAQREAGKALEDLETQQALLANALSRALEARVADDEHEVLTKTKLKIDIEKDALASVRSVDRAGELRVLVKLPRREDWVSVDGRPEKFTPRAGDSFRLSHEEAAELGLPPRMAIAGIASFDADVLGTWKVAVVATARAERDRQIRALWRLLLGVGVAAGLVVAFGGRALVQQKKELELRHALERDERMRAADKLATMGALATGIAHEVSTPLGVIVQRAEQIQGGDERTARAAKAIAKEAARIDEVIRGFLALARGASPTLTDDDPTDLAKVALDLVEHRFATASVTLSSKLASDLPRVSCDPRLFEQVLVNLLLNACEACDRGGSVELETHRTGDRVAFVVTDDGSGISSSDAARVKEPFFTTKPAGHGLGLAIANEIVNHHRGSLSLRARSDARGTQAVVELPIHG